MKPNLTIDADPQPQYMASPQGVVGRSFLRYPSKAMKKVSAFAHVAGLTARSPSRRKGSRHDRFAVGGSCSVLVGVSGAHRGVGLRWPLTPAPRLALAKYALNPLHFSGGPSSAPGWAALRPGGAPASLKKCRALAGFAAARCRLAVHVGLALARAASDNKLIDTDAQVHPCAARTRRVYAGHLQR